MFISMKMISIHVKRRKVFRLVLITVWLVSVAASLQPAWAAVGCVVNKTSQHILQTKHHTCCTCCENTARCDCELNQDESANATEQTLALTSSVSNVVSKDIIFCAEPSILPPIERQTTDDTKALARGPSISVYLQTIKLLC
jgi:hypothetical protein